jgi:hypothetical protein
MIIGSSPKACPVVLISNETPTKEISNPSPKKAGPNLLRLIEDAVTKGRTGKTQGDNVVRSPAKNAKTKLIDDSACVWV